MKRDESGQRKYERVKSWIQEDDKREDSEKVGQAELGQ